MKRREVFLIFYRVGGPDSTPFRSNDLPKAYDNRQDAVADIEAENKRSGDMFDFHYHVRRFVEE